MEICLDSEDLATALRHCGSRARFHREHRNLIVTTWRPDPDEAAAIRAVGAGVEHLGEGFRRWLEQRTGEAYDSGL